MLPAAPTPTSSASGSQGATKSHASFVITIPKTAATPAAGVRPAYVSAATQSITVAVSQSTSSGLNTVLNETVNLTPSSSGCSSSLAGTTCTLTMNLNPGTYSASITTYDGTNGSGNALSTGQGISFTVVANENNVVPLGLSGIPTSIIAMAGSTSNSVYVLAKDADGNYIVGAGAPTIVVAPSPASQTAVATVTGPTSSTPNTVSFAAGSNYGTETFSVTATYPSGQTNACAEAGAVCSLATPITVSNGAGTLFTDNYEDNNLLGYTVPFSSNTQSPSINLGNVNYYPYWGIAINSKGTVFTWGYDTTENLVITNPPYTSETVDSNTGIEYGYYFGAADSNGDVFIPNFPSGSATGQIGIIKSPYTSVATELTNGVDEPYGAAIDSSNNLYVANEGNDTVTVYASPYTSPFATVATTTTPYGVVVSGSKMYVTETGKIDVFTLPVTSSSTPAATLTMTGYSYGAAAVDPKGNLWVGCFGQSDTCAGSSDGAVYEFTTPFSNGETPAVTLTYPAGSGSTSYETTGIGFDSLGNLYVDNGYGGSEEGGLLEYSGTITSSSKPTYAIETSTLYYPWGIVMAPGGLTVTP